MTKEETYAATLAAKVFRLLMAILAAFDLEARQYDAINAFINALLRTRQYCKLPPGFDKKGWLLQLLRALYGLKESPRL